MITIICCLTMYSTVLTVVSLDADYVNTVISVGVP